MRGSRPRSELGKGVHFMASEFPKDTIGQPPSGGMVDRIKRLLLTPKEEWPVIDTQPMSAMGIFTSWVVPLAAIGPIAGLIGSQVFGMGGLFVHITMPLTFSIVLAVLGYGASLVAVWVLALVIDALAPNFGSVKNRDQAMKAAAFSYTAAWVAGIFQIIPSLAIIGLLLALYSFYLLWVGLPVVMKTPVDKVPGYVILSVVVAIIVQFVISLIIAAITGSMMTSALLGAASLSSATGSGGTVTIGGTTIDTGKMEAASAKMAAAAKSMESSVNGNGSGGTKAVDPNALQGLLPGALSGWNRTSIESNGGGAAGINGSNARAEFSSGDQNFSLSVTDLGALGNLATLGGALNASTNKQTATGYEKSEMKDGNMVEEKWDNQSKSGTYSVMVASRFSIEASGSAPSIDTLKAAVAAVNIGQLQSLAK
jgi:hypothetical protein